MPTERSGRFLATAQSGPMTSSGSTTFAIFSTQQSAEVVVMSVADEDGIDLFDARALQERRDQIAPRIQAGLPAIWGFGIRVGGAGVVKAGLAGGELQDDGKAGTAVNVGNVQAREDEGAVLCGGSGGERE